VFWIFVLSFWLDVPALAEEGRFEEQSQPYSADVATSSAHTQPPRSARLDHHLGTATVARSIVCSQQTVLNWKSGRSSLRAQQSS